MLVNELRIGNLVYIAEEDYVLTIDRQMFPMHPRLPNIEDYRPIPITEEWLLKFGFEKDNDYGFWTSPNPKFIVDENFVLCDIDITVAVKHVHQLQNLYYALTGKELCL